VVWLLVLAGSAWWGMAHREPTDREQTTVGEAQPFVDEAIARVAATVSAGGGVVAVSPFERVGSCDVSLVRGGERYQRVLDAIVAPGTELDMFTRVAAALPSRYKPAVRTGVDPRLTADAGLWVLLTGTVTAPGELRFVADTGDCRPLGDLPVQPEATVPDDTVPGLLARLDVTEVSRTAASVSCVDGGRLVTGEVRATAYSGDLRDAMNLPDGSSAVVDEPRLVAYGTSGGVQVGIRAHEDATIVTTTTVCQ
jgi:hypothetical protein